MFGFPDKKKFELQIKESIQTKLQSLGLETGYRKDSLLGYVKYPEYLTPTLSKLPTTMFQEIENASFSLKSLDTIVNDTIKFYPNNTQLYKFLNTFKKNYTDIFDFSRDGQKCFTVSNSEQKINLMRCLYDLSVRYRKDKNLLVNCKYLISGFTKLFGARMGLSFDQNNFEIELKNFLTNLEREIKSFFKIADNKFMDDVSYLLKQMELTQIEQKILKEFIDICPPYEKISDLMEQFYTEYYNKFIDKESDISGTAAWIIKNFCDIHPFADGNGRVARKLASNFITLRTGLSFEDEEIDNWGKSPDYIAATSRINQYPERFDLLVSWVNQAMLNKQIPASFFNSYRCGAVGCEPLLDNFEWDEKNKRTISTIKLNI